MDIVLRDSRRLRKVQLKPVLNVRNLSVDLSVQAAELFLKEQDSTLQIIARVSLQKTPREKLVKRPAVKIKLPNSKGKSEDIP